MKQCAYCGNEYSDDTTLCTIDRQPLNEAGVVASMAAQKDAASETSPAPQESDFHVVYPEYRWSARDAWKFLGMYLVFSVMEFYVTGALSAHFRPFYLWFWGPMGVVTMTLIYVCVGLLTAAYFARTETFISFCQAMGLDRRPSKYFWLGIAAALGIQLVSYILHTLHLEKWYSDNYEIGLFEAASGPQRYLYLFPLMFAPFWEELVNRGFLYKSFRGSYSVPVATSLILAWTVFTHWNQYRHFGWAVIGLSTLTVVQCYLREKSKSLWDCIGCHFAFNAFTLFFL